MDTQTWVEPLSERETEIVSLISEGLSNREISRALNLSVETIKWYNKQIYSKLGVGRRLQAVKKATDLGLLDAGIPTRGERGELPQGNLPTPLSSFVGRERAMEEVRDLLRSSRLVVLTGPGGSGKTRLALETARELVDSYRDGAWFVELGSVSDPSLVAESIAEDLGVDIGPERPTAEILARFLADRHLLLILDNLEHLLEAAPLVGELLASAPKVSVLATSRERLHISGEQEYAVDPLALPDLAPDQAATDLQETEAVLLFTERAKGAEPGFSPDQGELDAIARICVTLGGLPLAIELAASHIKTLPPRMLAERLEEDLDALPPGPRDLPARQRTLRGTIEWSYNLLSSAEKRILVRMAIFSGGCTLAGIRAVCAPGIRQDPMDPLSGLVEKNLVVKREDPDGELRFMMPELIRAYGLEQLDTRNELTDLRLRHAEYYAQLVSEAAEDMRTGRQNRWFKRLAADQDNIRAVLAWSLEGDLVEFGMQIVGGMMDYWFYNGAAAEGKRWIDMALKRVQGTDPALRAEVLASAGKVAHGLGELSVGRGYSQEAVDLYREVGEERKMAVALADLGYSYLEHEKEIPRGIEHAQRALAILRRLEYEPGMASTLNILGELYRVQGDDEAALQCYEESLALVEGTGERQREAMLLGNLCFIACHRGEYDRALDLIQRSLKIIQELDNDYGFACFVGVAAGPAAGLGEWEQAARLLGASEGLYEKLGSKNQYADQIEIDRTISDVRDQLGPQAFEGRRREGFDLTRPEILSIIFDELGDQAEA